MATKASLRRAAEQTAAACIDAKANFLAKRDALRAASDAYNAALLAHTQACEALTAAFPSTDAPSAPEPEIQPPAAQPNVAERRRLFGWFGR
jgi:hypothetical protein